MRTELKQLLTEASPKIFVSPDGYLIDTNGNYILDYFGNKILAHQEGTRPLYTIEYEESSMQNVQVDSLTRDSSFVYIEEFVGGNYNKLGFFNKKTVETEIYFCKFVNMHMNANIRQDLRDLMEAEIVLPFIDLYEKSGIFAKVENWRFFYPVPKYDANEVGILLTFDCSKARC